jgi:iduronate 2-sulfatase
VDVKEQPLGSLPDIQIKEFAVEALKNRSKSEDPFFLAVGFHKPHIPLHFPKHYLGKLTNTCLSIDVFFVFPADLYPLRKINPPPHPKLPQDLPPVAWNPWEDLRKREDIATLNLSMPYGPMPDHYTVRSEAQ